MTSSNNAGGPGLAFETLALAAKRNPGLKSETWATPFVWVLESQHLTIFSEVRPRVALRESTTNCASFTMRA
jgi:hypothetical protein